MHNTTNTTRTLHVLGALIISSALSATLAHAGAEVQGAEVQGAEVQGAEVQGVALDNITLSGLGFDTIDLVGTEVIGTVTTTSGTTEYRPLDLVGAVWTQVVDGLGTRMFRIALAAQDTTSNLMQEDNIVTYGEDISSNDDVWLFTITYWNASSQTWDNLCTEGGEGFFVEGTWDDTGSWSSGGMTFACQSGVVSKCARQWGYKPWKTVEHVDAVIGQVDLQPLHQACTRAARADYCGNGTPNTVDGTVVDMTDAYGFNLPAAQVEINYVAAQNLTSPVLPYILTVESFFSPVGATAVHHDRIPGGSLTTVDGETVFVGPNGCTFPVFNTASLAWAEEFGAPLISIASHEVDWMSLQQ